VTKNQQRIDINEKMILTDTPGMMWPKIDNELDGIFLAASHTIGVNAYDEIEIALGLFDVIKELYPKSITSNYKIDPPFPQDEEFLASIAKHRGFIIKGGELNIQKAAIVFINDYRQGILGRVSLETPESRNIRFQSKS